MEQFKRGDVVKIGNPVGEADRLLATTRADAAAVFLEYTKPHGYARIAFYGDAKEKAYLAHPESLQLVHSSDHA